MQIRIINAPEQHLIEMLLRRVTPEARTWLAQNPVSSIALFQANIADLYYFSDVAMKAADVYTAEVLGSCPTHVTTVALFGDTSAITAAARAIESVAAAH